MDIELNFINNSNDANNSQIVIFQQNDSLKDAPAVAWKVIKNCGRSWSHTIKFPVGFSVGVADSFGNTSNLAPAKSGEQWEVITAPSGHQLSLSANHAASPEVIEVRNSLSAGAVDAHIYKDGKVIGIKTGIQPGQKATFGFRPTIHIGVVSEMTEGEVIPPAMVQHINTEISLLGILKADIIMTGGGTGANAEPFTFMLIPTAYA